MKLACPDKLEDTNLQDALKRLQAAINNNPLMLGGTNQLCDVFNRDKNVIAKGGAQGVYCFGLKNERQGFAMKMEDGPSKFWPVMAGEILKQINYDNKKTVEDIDAITRFKIVNDNKYEVGRVQPVFKLS
jgi:L-asparaginase II